MTIPLPMLNEMLQKIYDAFDGDLVKALDHPEIVPPCTTNHVHDWPPPTDAASICRNCGWKLELS